MMSLGNKTPFHQKGIHPVFSDIFNSLWPNDAIWQHRSRSTLVQVMAWCLHAWRHQAITWTNVDWSSAKSNDIHIRAISRDASTTNHWNPFENNISKSSFRFPRGQWVKEQHIPTILLFLWCSYNQCYPYSSYPSWMAVGNVTNV